MLAGGAKAAFREFLHWGFVERISSSSFLEWGLLGFRLVVRIICMVPSRAGLRASLALGIVLMSLYLAHAIREQRHGHNFLCGDPTGTYLVTESLLTDRDFELRNQLQFDAAMAADQMSVGRRGEWYNSHEPLLSVLGVPFVGLLGGAGALVCNMLLTVLTVLVMFRTWSGRAAPAFAAALLVGCSYHFRAYSFSYSNDVLGTLLLVGGYAFFERGRYASAGIVLGLLFFARLPFVPLIAAFAAALFFIDAPSGTRRDTVRQAARLLTPVAVALLLFLSINYLQFGSFLATSYSRWIPAAEQPQTTVSHWIFFNRSIFHGLGLNLFDQRVGLISNAPLIVAGLLLMGIAMWKQRRAAAVIIYGSTLLLLVIFSLYSKGEPSTPNRYHLPIIALSVAPWALAFDRCMPLLSRLCARLRIS